MSVRSYIDEIRHSALLEYWGRVGFIRSDGLLYDIEDGEQTHHGLTIDQAFEIMRRKLGGRRTVHQFKRVKLFSQEQSEPPEGGSEIISSPV